MVRFGPEGPQFGRSVGTLVCRQLVNMHDIFFDFYSSRRKAYSFTDKECLQNVFVNEIQLCPYQSVGNLSICMSNSDANDISFTVILPRRKALTSQIKSTSTKYLYL